MLTLVSYITKYVAALLSVVLCLFTSFPFIISQGQTQKKDDVSNQQVRIQQLAEDYANGNYTKVDENSITDFDLQQAFADGVKINEVSFIATHNSYQTTCTPAYTRLMKNLSTVTFGLVDSEITSFNSDTLTEQFNLGIRSIELDVETKVKDNNVSFVCSHSPVIDQTSTCYDFELALEEVKMWSDANPGHLPITIIIEPKKVFIPESGMRYFTVSYANKLGDLLHDVLGDTLITPNDMLGNYTDFKEMREDDGWMTLEETTDHVMVLLHDTTVTDKYISQDKSIKTQAMFPMLRYADRDKDYASFLLINKANDAIKQGAELLEKNIIFRTRSDEYGSISEKELENALNSNAHIISTDYPIKKDMTNVEHHVSFNNEKTARLVK